MKPHLFVLLAGLLWMQCKGYAKPKYTVTWMGNSFPGASQWVQQDIRALWVTPDGTLFSNTEWDEAGREVGAYRDGLVIAKGGHTHGWGYEGGLGIAGNRHYLFIAQTVNNEGGHLQDTNTWPPPGQKWLGISRRSRDDLAQGAAFAGGKGGKGDTLRESFLVVAAIPEKSKLQITGLWADEKRLYVADPQENKVRIYETESMKPISDWAVERPGPLVMDADGRFWMLHFATDTAPARIRRYQANGQVLPGEIPLAAAVVPAAICLDAQNRLWVIDDGPAQQLLIYDHLGRQPRLAGTFGKEGGIYAETPGEVAPLKFNHPKAIGCDARGNIYVASDGQTGGGGTVLESYHPSGKLNWRLLGLEFVDMADVDPDSDADVFTKEEYFRLDYSQPRGQEWDYRGYTVHRFKYPQDPRLHLWSAGAWVRRLRNQRFLFVTDMNAEYLQVYRFNTLTDGEIGIPSGLFAKSRLRTDNQWPPYQPARGEWIWRDLNGNGAFDGGEYSTLFFQDAPPAQGWWVDMAGNVWLATETNGMRCYFFQGIDVKGNPMWTYDSMRAFPHPAPLRRVKRLRYLPDQDIMYLGGTTVEHANQHWKPMGPVICRFDHWLKGEPKLRWQIVAPYAKGAQGHESCEPMGFDVAGDFLFVPYTGASREMKFKSGHIEILRADDGRSMGFMEPPEDIGEIGLQDIRECLRVNLRKNGDYLVFIEEEWKSKILIYHWRP